MYGIVVLVITSVCFGAIVGISISGDSNTKGDQDAAVDVRECGDPDKPLYLTGLIESGRFVQVNFIRTYRILSCLCINECVMFFNLSPTQGSPLCDGPLFRNKYDKLCRLFHRRQEIQLELILLVFPITSEIAESK